MTKQQLKKTEMKEMSLQPAVFIFNEDFNWNR